MTTQQIQAGKTRNHARITDLLKWTEQTRTNFVFNSGILFLSLYMADDLTAISKTIIRSEFWNWWQIMWDARDQAFIDDWDGAEDGIPYTDLVKIYRDLHSPKMLLGELKLPRVVFGNDFTRVELISQ